MCWKSLAGTATARSECKVIRLQRAIVLLCLTAQSRRLILDEVQVPSKGSKGVTLFDHGEL